MVLFFLKTFKHISIIYCKRCETIRFQPLNKRMFFILIFVVKYLIISNKLFKSFKTVRAFSRPINQVEDS